LYYAVDVLKSPFPLFYPNGEYTLLSLVNLAADVYYHGRITERMKRKFLFDRRFEVERFGRYLIEALIKCAESRRARIGGEWDELRFPGTFEQRTASLNHRYFKRADRFPWKRVGAPNSEASSAAKLLVALSMVAAQGELARGNRDFERFEEELGIPEAKWWVARLRNLGETPHMIGTKKFVILAWRAASGGERDAPVAGDPDGEFSPL